VAIAYDDTSRSVRVMEYRWAGAATDWDAGAGWFVDPLVPPAVLDDAQITSVTVDTTTGNPRSWTIEFAPGEARPAVSIAVGREGSTRTWRIVMPSGAMRADMTDSVSGSGSVAGSASVDLDRTGRAEVAW
jgi:hypothetical protein